jgi:hypothetical protein
MTGFNNNFVGFSGGGSSGGGGSGTNTVETNASFIGTDFTLSQPPAFIYAVYLNGQYLTEGADYTVSGNDITFLFAISNSVSITVVYNY